MFSVLKRKKQSLFFTTLLSMLLILALPLTTIAATKGHPSDNSPNNHSGNTGQENPAGETSGHEPEEKKVDVKQGNYQIQVITPESMFEGENEIKVIITRDDKPAKSLAVTLAAEMDLSDASMNMSHGETEKPVTQTLSEIKDGEYSGTLNFEGDGKWLLTVQFLDQKTSTEIMIKRNGPNWLVVGGFSGIILAIILTAGILKHKEAKVGIGNETSD